MGKGKAIKIDPIGVVRNDFEEEIPEGYEKQHSEIVLGEEFSEALHRIEENSHIVVLFWMDRVEEKRRKKMKIHPKGRKDLPLMGVLATRTPHRPNPIGVRAVKLIGKKKNVLKVEGLDALNGSPVLDIKPYSIKHDLVENAKVPWWAKHLFNKEE
jgi:tRNA-Thr(GGU) m(6)t(6)A37 methyltransferase TsaA